MCRHDLSYDTNADAQSHDGGFIYFTEQFSKFPVHLRRAIERKKCEIISKIVEPNVEKVFKYNSVHFLLYSIPK